MNKSDEQLILEHARSEIQGRIDYWFNLYPQEPHAKYVIANLQWALAQLDGAPGRIMALRKKHGL